MRISNGKMRSCRNLNILITDEMSTYLIFWDSSVLRILSILYRKEMPSYSSIKLDNEIISPALWHSFIFSVVVYVLSIKVLAIFALNDSGADISFSVFF